MQYFVNLQNALEIKLANLLLQNWYAYISVKEKHPEVTLFYFSGKKNRECVKIPNFQSFHRINNGSHYNQSFQPIWQELFPY